MCYTNHQNTSKYLICSPIDIDECVEGTSGCDHVCINLNGTYECECYDGYTLYVGHHCQGQDNTIIIFHFNSALCKGSPPNIRLVIIHFPIILRIDINECDDGDNGGCEDKCTNIDGSYKCSCPAPGYTLGEDQHSCPGNEG